ncbi:MAG TPA: site-specific integrase [Vicinamibacterales bacterium]
MSRKKKPAFKDTSVRKRCSHVATGEWELCNCAFHYYLTHQGKKHRGIIPDVRTYDEALAAFVGIKARIQNGQPAVEAKESDATTVEQLADDWLTTNRGGLKASAIRAYRDQVRAHINPALGKMRVVDVTHRVCERFIQNLQPIRMKRPLSENTKTRIAVTLQALFKFAIDYRRSLGITDNPARGLAKLVRDPDSTRDDVVLDPNDPSKFFTAEEAAHLLRVVEAKHPEWHVFIRTAIETGMRMGELSALRYQDINWRGRYLTVRSNWVQGKFTSPKNGKSRQIRLDKRLRALLRLRWREHRDSTRLVFPSENGTPMDPKNFRRRAWQAILESAELDYRTPHAMRHTHTTILLANGVSLTDVAAQAGRSPNETWRTYFHFLPRGGADAATGVISRALDQAAERDTPRVLGGVSGAPKGDQRPRAATRTSGISRDLRIPA